MNLALYFRRRPLRETTSTMSVMSAPVAVKGGKREKGKRPLTFRRKQV
jgi:hypothetical protein